VTGAEEGAVVVDEDEEDEDADLLTLRKYFCACVRVCTTLLVLTMVATFFHSLPKSLRASRNRECSCRVQRPVDSLDDP
jgi:hypothetical protein